MRWDDCSGIPFSALKIPVLRIPFESTAISASGIRAALDVMGKEDIHVLALAGDGELSISAFRPYRVRREK